jgi:hypothetical protein
MTETQSALLTSLTLALSQMGAKEFMYYWEWVHLLPGRSIHINKEMIDDRYDLPDDYGLEDLEALCETGYLEKVSESRKGEPFHETKIIYKLSEPIS